MRSASRAPPSCSDRRRYGPRPGRRCAGGLDDPHGTECSRQAAPAEHRAGADGRLLPRAARHDAAGAPDAGAGATYRNAHVVDSLCCPSRASIFTGRAAAPDRRADQHRRTTRSDPIGGYRAFVAQRQRAARPSTSRCTNSGYTTGFVGKYMNGYELKTNDGEHFAPAKVPGWNVFEAILGGGYPEWGFRSTYLDEDGVDAAAAHAEAAAQLAGRRCSTGTTPPT